MLVSTGATEAMQPSATEAETIDARLIIWQVLL
jgi:hypothetical protein